MSDIENKKNGRSWLRLEPGFFDKIGGQEDLRKRSDRMAKLPPKKRTKMQGEKDDGER